MRAVSWAFSGTAPVMATISPVENVMGFATDGVAVAGTGVGVGVAGTGVGVGVLGVGIGVLVEIGVTVGVGSGRLGKVRSRSCGRGMPLGANGIVSVACTPSK